MAGDICIDGWLTKGEEDGLEKGIIVLPFVSSRLRCNDDGDSVKDCSSGDQDIARMAMSSVIWMWNILECGILWMWACPHPSYIPAPQTTHRMASNTGWIDIYRSIWVHLWLIQYHANVSKVSGKIMKFLIRYKRYEVSWADDSYTFSITPFGKFQTRAESHAFLIVDRLHTALGSDDEFFNFDDTFSVDRNDAICRVFCLSGNKLIHHLNLHEKHSTVFDPRPKHW